MVWQARSNVGWLVKMLHAPIGLTDSCVFNIWGELHREQLKKRRMAIHRKCFFFCGLLLAVTSAALNTEKGWSLVASPAALSFTHSLEFTRSTVPSFTRPAPMKNNIEIVFLRTWQTTDLLPLILDNTSSFIHQILLCILRTRWGIHPCENLFYCFVSVFYLFIISCSLIFALAV